MSGQFLDEQRPLILIGRTCASGPNGHRSHPFIAWTGQEPPCFRSHIESGVIDPDPRMVARGCGMALGDANGSLEGNQRPLKSMLGGETLSPCPTRKNNCACWAMSVGGVHAHDPIPMNGEPRDPDIAFQAGAIILGTP